MNSSSHSGSGKRPIFDAFDTASDISDVRFASFGAGLFGMRGAGKIRSFAAQQRSSLFCSGFFGRNGSQSSLTDFFSGFFGSDIPAVLRHHVSVALFKMLLSGKTLKVLKPVICLVVIYMVNLFAGVKVQHPTFSHNAMNKVFAAHAQIAAVMEARRIRKQLSKDFSAARNSVKMVKESIFDSINYYAGHGVPFGVIMSDQVLT